jgi:hypothetical protein
MDQSDFGAAPSAECDVVDTPIPICICTRHGQGGIAHGEEVCVSTPGTVPGAEKDHDVAGAETGDGYVSKPVVVEVPGADGTRDLTSPHVLERCVAKITVAVIEE